ncbi:AMP-binding protein [Paractinoplanes durhamensis]|uniref:AMP-binding protein n=1 Tax=Paractinoplanes durhamensis TaxID=113563 RepID=UPI003629BEBE
MSAAGADPVPAGPPADVSGAELPDDPSAPATFGAALERAAAEAAERGMTYLASDGTEQFQSFAELRSEAARVLGALRTAGAVPGDPIIFQCLAKRNVVVAFWACALGGYVATPVSVPLEYGRDDAGTRKLRAIWDLLDRPLVLTEERLAADIGDLGSRWTGASVHLLTMERALLAETAEPRAADPEEAVLHLLTSGSTGVPKCVRHTHRSLLARIRSAALHNDFTAADTSLSWMPIDHVGGWLYNASAAVHRNDHVNAEMDAFLADPLRWMDWVHRFRVANVWTPNFALSLVNEHAHEMAGRDWDLSCLRHICSGGEAVVSQVVHRFSQLLRPFGLPDRAVHPSFGMSEVAAGVTYSALDGRDENVGVLRVDKDSLSGRLRFDGPAWRQTAFTELGGPIPGVRLRIVGEDSRVLPEDHVGRLQISGVTMMAGYHRNGEANAASFTADGWFDSKDLGFLHRGSLTLTGRDGDMIIVQGANFFSHDIEAVVEQVPGTEVSFVAALADRGAGTGADQLIVFFAPVGEGVEQLRTTISGIRARMVQELGISPDRVVPVPRARFPKTEIGKIQRRLLIDQLHDGAFDETLRAVADAGAEPGSALFAPIWMTVPAPSGPAPVGVWIVHEGRHTSLAEQLRLLLPAGVRLVVTRPGDGFAGTGADEFTVPPTDRGAHDRLLDTVTGFGPVVAVLHAGNLEPAPAPSDIDDLAGFFAARAVLQALAARSGPKPALLVLTTGGVVAETGDRAELAKVALPGLIRTAAAEGRCRSCVSSTCPRGARDLGGRRRGRARHGRRGGRGPPRWPAVGAPVAFGAPD